MAAHHYLLGRFDSTSGIVSLVEAQSDTDSDHGPVASFNARMLSMGKL
jgi:hypothetical protein